MNGKTFVDTNMLVYAHDIDAKAKHEAAKVVLRDLWRTRTGVLSVQVLQEFYVNVTRKIPRPLPRNAARQVVSAYSIWCVDTAASDISMAFKIEHASKIGFWDALIVASAVQSGAARIVSEDLNAGQVIAGVRIENPFLKTGRT